MDKVKYRDKRNHERFETGGGCLASVDNSARISVKNISLSGVRLIVTQPLYKDSIHTIDIFSANGQKITLTARVIWSYFHGVSSINSAVSFYEAGFKFVGMDKDKETSLKKIISGLR